MYQDIADVEYNLWRIITAGWSLFRAHLLSILALGFTVYTPLAIIFFFFNKSNLIEVIGWPGLFPLAFLSELPITLSVLAIAILIEASIREEEITWRQALGHALLRFPACVKTYLLYAIVISFMSLLLIVPGIVCIIYYTFSIPIVALRGLSGFAALDYSKTIVKLNWWRISGYTIALGALTIATQSLINSPSYLIESTTSVWGQSDSAPYWLLGMLASLPFLVMRIVFFLNQDYLKKGTDFGIRAERRARLKAWETTEAEGSKQLEGS